MANIIIAFALVVLVIYLLVKFSKAMNRAVDAAQISLIKTSAEAHGRALRDMRKAYHKSTRGKVSKKEINSLSVDELADRLTLSIGEDY